MSGGTWLWWSSGKDSAWALECLPEVTALVTTVTPTFGRVAVHGTRIEILEAQAAAAGLPLLVAEVPYPCTNDDYEAAVRPIIERAREEDVRAMAFGDLFLEDVRAYRERLLVDSGIEPHFPLWGRDTTTLIEEMLSGGLQARIVSLDPSRVDPSWAGRLLDEELLASLGDGVDPCGENGEFHTCVIAGPMLDTPISVDLGEVVEREGFVYADLVPLTPRR
ncbi:MAG: ATP-binding protein [Gemmatimonadota bacterium]